MDEQPNKDRDVERNAETHHPFQYYKLSVDPRESVFVVCKRFRRFARFVLRRAGRDKRVIDL